MRFAEVVGHGRACASLRAAVRDGRVASAYLVAGPRGVGKRRLADAFATRLLCSAPAADDACGSCAQCVRVSAGTHPDLRIVVRDTDRRDIRTEQAREMTRWLALRPLMAERKVAVIDDAEQLNEHGQNALLKTLEEPPGAATLLLVTSVPSALLPTVRSRCQRVRLDPLAASDLSTLLCEHGLAPAHAAILAARATGSLGTALALADDAQERARATMLGQLPALAERSAAELSGLAQEITRGALAPALDAAVSWYRDVLGRALGTNLPLRNPEHAAAVDAAAGHPPAARLRQLDLLCDTITAIEQNANRQLAVETLLLGLRAIERRAARRGA